jgi:hypothetical protein
MSRSLGEQEILWVHKTITSPVMIQHGIVNILKHTMFTWRKVVVSNLVKSFLKLMIALIVILWLVPEIHIRKKSKCVTMLITIMYYYQ